MIRKGKDKQRNDSIKSDEKLFCDNAFFLLENAEKIMSDSCMFLAPVPVVNGLAYTGSFRQATLGAYLEWWLNDPQFSTASDKKLGDMLIWHIAGSPLSGGHACCGVNRDGEIKTVKLNARFSDTWHSFLKYNSRYQEAKSKYAAYDLHQVITLLCGEHSSDDNYKNAMFESFFLRAQIKCLEDLLNPSENESPVAHDGNELILTNGATLRCYTPLEVVTAHYRRIEDPVSSDASVLECFLSNIDLLTEHKEQIISEPRYCNTHISLHISAGRPGYGGRVGLPTLGKILEWWQAYPQSSVIDENGVKWRIVGANRRIDIDAYTFYGVNHAGEEQKVYPTSPAEVWQSLCAAIRKQPSEANLPGCTIFEVVAILKSGSTQAPAWIEENLRLRSHAAQLQAQVADYRKELRIAKLDSHRIVMQAIGPEVLRAAWNQFRDQQKVTVDLFRKLAKEKKRLYKQKNTSEITCNEYEHRVKCINQQRRELRPLTQVEAFPRFLKSMGLPSDIRPCEIAQFLSANHVK